MFFLWRTKPMWKFSMSTSKSLYKQIKSSHSMSMSTALYRQILWISRTISSDTLQRKMQSYLPKRWCLSGKHDTKIINCKCRFLLVNSRLTKLIKNNVFVNQLIRDIIANYQKLIVLTARVRLYFIKICPRCYHASLNNHIFVRK